MLSIPSCLGGPGRRTPGRAPRLVLVERGGDYRGTAPVVASSIAAPPLRPFVRSPIDIHRCIDHDRFIDIGQSLGGAHMSGSSSPATSPTSMPPSVSARRFFGAGPDKRGPATPTSPSPTPAEAGAHRVRPTYRYDGIAVRSTTSASKWPPPVRWRRPVGDRLTRAGGSPGGPRGDRPAASPSRTRSGSTIPTVRRGRSTRVGRRPGGDGARLDAAGCVPEEGRLPSGTEGAGRCRHRACC